MTAKKKRIRRPKDLQSLLNESLNNPGVADMLQIYDRAEIVYQQISGAFLYSETISSSTTDSLPFGD